MHALETWSARALAHEVVSDTIAPMIIRYWAAARELAGRAKEELSLSAAIAEPELRKVIATRHPGLASYLDRMKLAINGEVTSGAAEIRPGDEVDVLPPVAGGASERVMLLAIRDTPLSLDEAFAAVAHPSAGGIAIFTGVVRDHADGEAVGRLDYEAHPTLATKELERVIGTVTRDFPDARIAAVHRVGQLAVGDLAVVVAASSAHRAEAFAACRAAIDRIKETVPIWKKEWSPEGNAHWVNLEE